VTYQEQDVKNFTFILQCWDSFPTRYHVYQLQYIFCLEDQTRTMPLVFRALVVPSATRQAPMLGAERNKALSVFVMARLAPMLEVGCRKQLGVSHATRLDPMLGSYAREEIILG
jgi:hypothetical protein